MTIASIDLIMTRIAGAEIHSPIAVFRVDPSPAHKNNSKLPFLDAVFANTVNTYVRIRECDVNLIGVFYRDNDPITVMRILLRARRR